ITTHPVLSTISLHDALPNSPFFRQLPLEKYGLGWIQPDFPLAHPLEDGTAAVLERSVARTAACLGHDQKAYERLFSPLVTNWERSEEHTSELQSSGHLV